MNPILFAENATNFTTNGLGRLSDTIECFVTEERNGIFELEMIYPMYGQHYSEIGIRSIIVAKPAANANLQAFRVYKMDKPIGGRVKIYAQHISYDLSKNTVMPFEVTASASACINTLGGLYTNAVESCPFYFTTDVTTVASYTQKTPASIKSRLGGVRGSVLDQFGGEYEWDNYTVKLWRNRGIVTNITLRYGKNIIDLEQEENIANTVTGVVPFWSNIDGDEVVTLSEKVVRSSHASQYSEYLTVPLDLSQEWDEAPTEEQLRTAATVYVNKEGFGIPKVSTTVSFVNLAETEEYKDLLPLQNVNLCDTITVQFEKLGISTTAKIVKTVFNVLKERYDELQIGSLKSNLASTITDAEAATVQAISDSGQRVFAEANTEAQDLINNATAWLTSSGGYVIAIKNNDGTWKELLFMDTNDVTTAHNVLRVNENGIGFSSTGVGGPFTQAWTLDGKLVIGGTNVPSLTVYKADGQTILFQVDKDKIIWNVPNSSMDAQGRITANNAVINGIIKSLSETTGHICEMIMDSASITTKHNNQITARVIAGYDGLEITSNNSNNIYMLSDNNMMIRGPGRVAIESRSSSGSGTGTLHGHIVINSDGGEDIEISAADDIDIVADDIYLRGAVSIQGTLDVRDGVSRTFYYKNEDGNNSWLRFQKGILVEWG